MEKRYWNLESLRQRILAAQEGHGYDPDLIDAILEHCRKRREDDLTLEFVGYELGISTWQLLDWSAGKMPSQGSEPRREEQGQDKRLTFMVNIRSTRRFEQLLAREIARSMQRCDSCCWEQLVKSLPSDFKAGKADES
jgi:hypothetical protein